MGLRLVKTCDACPEQYEAFCGQELVGYLRLRHGSFRVECPDAGGEIVYKADTKGDGRFTDAERPEHLNAALGAIEAWLTVRNGHDRGRPA